MKILYLLLAIIFSLLITRISLQSQYGNFKMDNGIIQGYYGNNANFEETVILKPTVPGIATKAYIYLSGTKAAKDTIWFVGDPAEGSFPPTLWCRYINTYLAVVIDYKGTAGWFEVDLTSYKKNHFNGIPTGGINAIAIQHTIKPGGPFFTIDTQPQNAENANSFLNDVYKPNPNFYNIAGTIVGLTSGKYMVRLQMEYSFVDDSGNPITDKIRPYFPDVTHKSGLVNSSGNPISFEMASVSDWNNDGYDDISISGNYFQNTKNGTFENISPKINIQNSGSVWADVDNDGYKDFYAVRGGSADRIYFGKSDGTYEESVNNNFAIDAPSVTPIFFDYDADGLLDLFIAYGRRESGGVETYYPDKLFKNIGNRQFKDVTVESGISKGEPAPYFDTWGASVCDFNSDGKPDIFVATYRLAPDLLYKNNGDGTFTEVGASTGVRGAPTYYENYFGHGMGSDWGNLQGSNNVDGIGLVVGNLGHPDSRAMSSNPSLAWSKLTGIDKFDDVTKQAGIGFYEMNAGMLLADLNNDRFNDLVHAQYAYYKKGAGKDKFTRFYIAKPSSEASAIPVFEDRTWELGPRNHGAWSPVRIEYENDGGMDVIVASSNDYAALYLNQMKRENWISFKLSGDGIKVNRDGFGTRINIYKDGQKFASSFLPGTVMNARAAQSSSDIHFGLGQTDKLDSIVAVFSDGKSINYGSLKINTKHWLKYDGTNTPLPSRKPRIIEPEDRKVYLPGTDHGLRAIFPSDEIECYYKIYDSNRKLQGTYSIFYKDGEGINDTLDFGIYKTFIEGKYYCVALAKFKDSSVVLSDTIVFYISFDKVIRLISPSNNITDVKLGTDLVWDIYNPYYKSIHLQVSKNQDFSEPVFNKKIQHSVMITNFNPSEFVNEYNTKYYWRVRGADNMDANGDGNWGPWSDIFNFTTETGTSVENEKRNLAKFGFIGIYPNPTNNLTSIEFELPYFANLSIAVFDVNGNKVEEITEAYFEPGIHKISYDVTKIQSGSYFLKITDGFNIISTKLNVIK